MPQPSKPIKEQGSSKIRLSSSQVAELGPEFASKYEGLDSGQRAQLAQALLDQRGRMTATRDEAMRQIQQIAG